MLPWESGSWVETGINWVKSTQVEGTASSWLQHGTVSISEQDSWKTRVQAPALRSVLCVKGSIMGWWQPKFKSQLSLSPVQPLTRPFTLAKPHIPPLEVGMVIYETVVIMNIRLLCYFSYYKGFQEKGNILFFSVSLTVFVQKGGTVAVSGPTLCDSIDCSLTGSSVHGISQARILEWVAISFSRGIFPTQGSNPHLLHWQAGSLPLRHQRRPLSKYLQGL